MQLIYKTFLFQKLWDSYQDSRIYAQNDEVILIVFFANTSYVMLYSKMTTSIHHIQSLNMCAIGQQDQLGTP